MRPQTEMYQPQDALGDHSQITFRGRHFLVVREHEVDRIEQA